MYIDRVPNRKSKPAVLLREAWREEGRVVKRTVANLTDWADDRIVMLELLLKGEKLVPVDELFEVAESLPHGHVEAVIGTMRRLGVPDLISTTPGRERDLVLALIAQRILQPGSKLEVTRDWHLTTLASELGVGNATTDEVYDAMDWLLSRQRKIEKKLARRHLTEGGIILYDVSSSYYTGRTCPLARRGHDRDGKGNRPIIVYGVMTDKDGRPIAVDVYPGDTGDPTTIPDQVQKLRQDFGLQKVIMVGDRGMLTQTQIDHLEEFPEIQWISALRSSSVKKLMLDGAIQMSLFGQDNLAQITSAEFPGERLVVCFNPELAQDRRRTREELLEATEDELGKIQRLLARRTRNALNKADVGVRVGRIINKYKVAKHFRLTIGDNHISWERKLDNIAAEAAIDGLYVVRTSVPEQTMSADDVVRSYKGLSRVEWAFRTLKTFDLRIRPIHHRLSDRVRAHIFLCMLSYYVEWHMREALAPILFADEELPDTRPTRNPVAPAKPSPSASRKKARKIAQDGTDVHSFRSLLRCLALRVKSTCQLSPTTANKDKLNLEVIRITRLSMIQRRAFELLGMCSQ